MWKRKPKRKPKKRDVYLMERTTNRTWQTIIMGKREIKIGIANDTQQRNKSVDSGIPGKVIILESYQIAQASTIEAELHRKYKHYNFTVKNAKQGAGGTEFHRLSSSQVRDIDNYLKEKSGDLDYWKLYCYCVVASIILTILLHQI